MATKDRTSLKNDFANGKHATGEKFADLIDSMKVVQLPVVDPQALGTSLSFIDSISQDADGKITATKKTLDLSNVHELNPFKGWWKTGDTLPTSGFDGAYLYFKDTTQTPAVTTIYRWNGTTYADTGTVVDESNVQTFATGQALNEVAIDGTGLANPAPNALAKAGDIKAVVGGSDSADLDVTDNNGNVLVRFKNGHIQTKEFDSSNIVIGSEELQDDAVTEEKLDAEIKEKINNPDCGLNIKRSYRGDLEICDDAGNVLVRFKNGHIKTKQFDSSNINIEKEVLYPKMAIFDLDTSLLSMTDELNGYVDDATDSIGCKTFQDQIINKIDALLTDYADYLTKYDAANLVNATYPTYANLDGVATEDYLATPTYKTWLYKFSNKLNATGLQNYYDTRKQKILIIAGVHGWENASIFNCYVLLKKLCEAVTHDYMQLRAASEIYVIPCLNGYGAYHGLRTNANNIDINRNFPSPTWSVRGEGTDHFSGNVAASEFETRLVMDLVDMIKPDILIDHHSYGAFVDYNFYQEYSKQRGLDMGYINLHAWTAQACKSYPQHFGTKGIVHPNGFVVENGQTLDAWGKHVGIEDSATIEVSIGIGFENGSRYPTAADFYAADTVWKEPSLQLNELALRLALLQYVQMHIQNDIHTTELNEDMLNY